MQRDRLSAKDLERISEVLSATEREWRRGKRRQSSYYAEDTGYFTLEDLRPPAAEPDRKTA